MRRKRSLKTKTDVATQTTPSLCDPLNLDPKVLLEKLPEFSVQTAPRVTTIHPIQRQGKKRDSYDRFINHIAKTGNPHSSNICSPQQPIVPDQLRDEGEGVPSMELSEVHEEPAIPQVEVMEHNICELSKGVQTDADIATDHPDKSINIVFEDYGARIRTDGATEDEESKKFLKIVAHTVHIHNHFYRCS